MVHKQLKHVSKVLDRKSSLYFSHPGSVPEAKRKHAVRILNGGGCYHAYGGVLPAPPAAATTGPQTPPRDEEMDGGEARDGDAEGARLGQAGGVAATGVVARGGEAGEDEAKEAADFGRMLAVAMGGDGMEVDDSDEDMAGDHVGAGDPPDDAWEGDDHPGAWADQFMLQPDEEAAAPDSNINDADVEVELIDGAAADLIAALDLPENFMFEQRPGFVAWLYTGYVFGASSSPSRV